jgi:ubiquinone/menaquinone biosynthesis C-methylase UbiE
MSKKIIDFYEDSFLEDQRLSQDIGPIERQRTLNILGRLLPPAPAIILDIGGATGAYSRYLLREGYSVHLVDLVPAHVETAAKAMAEVSENMKWSATVGDARELEFSDGFADAVLFLGPLYHLQRETDRLKALRECLRVLQPGGILLGAAVSKFASFLDGLSSGFIRDPEFRKIITEDLDSGCHHNPTNKPEYFTTAYFQHPDELESEIKKAGFDEVRILAVEGILWLARDHHDLANDLSAWTAAFDFMRRLETEKSIMGISPHIIGMGRKPNP